jgi:hypothetical protein
MKGQKRERESLYSVIEVENSKKRCQKINRGSHLIDSHEAGSYIRSAEPRYSNILA